MVVVVGRGRAVVRMVRGVYDQGLCAWGRDGLIDTNVASIEFF